MNNLNQHFDIIIVGGGIVGLTCANLLAQSDVKIAIIDSKPLDPITTSEQYDARVYAITRASQKLFQKTETWDEMLNARVAPYYKMTVWDACGKGNIHFNAQDIGESELGHIIEHRVIYNALLNKLQKLENMTLLSPIELNSFEIFEHKVTLSDKINQKFLSPLVIGADGANSWLRQQAQFEIKERDYGHHALVTTVKTELPHQKTAWQRFLPDGPLAFLPVDNTNTSSIVWSAPPDTIAKLKSLPDDQFKQELALAFENKLGSIESFTERYTFPLRMRHAKNYVQNHIALIGDAAHTIHPLAGQGVNLGILDAEALAHVIITAKTKNRHYASYHTLRRYERARKTQNLTMIATMDGFKQIFTSPTTRLQKLRNVGLSVANQSQSLKNLIMRFAMGKTN